MESHTVIRNPIVTEKSTDLTGKYNKYSFAVDRRANKIDVRKAIEALFKVKVTKVNVMNVGGKKRRVRFHQGKTPDWKKAVVTLKEGDKIEMI